MRRQARVWRPEGLGGVECLRASGLRVSFARHFHEGYALGVIESGALGFRYLGRDCLAPAGAVNMVAPGEVHDGHPASPHGWTYRMFYLEASEVERVAAGLTDGRAVLPVFAGGVVHDPLLAGSIRSLHLDLEAGLPTLLEGQSRLSAILEAWISRHAESRPRLRGGLEHAAVDRARQYLREWVAEPVSLAELAGVSGLSGCHLNRVFSRMVGLPPHAYQIQLRVERARGLLAAGMSPAEAAASSGFADQSHLNRHFRRLTGVTPGAYGKIVQDA